MQNAAEATPSFPVTLSALDNLSADQVELFAALEKQNIKTTTYNHEPIFTMEAGEYLKDHIPGTHCRSLLLTNKTGGFWMVSAADETTIDLKHLSNILGTPRFSFAKPEAMVELLRVTPGSLTPFALLFDQPARITVILDAYLMQQDQCVFHPLINGQSTLIDTVDLQRFIESTGHTPQILELSQNA